MKTVKIKTSYLKDMLKNASYEGKIGFLSYMMENKERLESLEDKDSKGTTVDLIDWMVDEINKEVE